MKEQEECQSGDKSIAIISIEIFLAARKEKGVACAPLWGKIAFKWGKENGEGRDVEKNSERNERKEACAIILGRASPLGPGHHDDNNNLNRAHLAYV